MVPVWHNPLRSTCSVLSDHVHMGSSKDSTSLCTRVRLHERGAAFGHRLEGCRLLIKRPACLLFFHYSFGTVLFSVAWSVLCAHACGKQPKMIPLRHSLHGRLLWREPIVYSHSL